MSEVNKIIVSRLSDKEIIKYADCKITHSYASNFNVSSGTIYDKRMGICEQQEQNCETCCNKFLTCSGGTGYIDLPSSYIYDGLSRIISFVCSIVCPRCSKLLINSDHMNIFEMNKQIYNKDIFTIIKIFVQKTSIQCKICKEIPLNLQFKNDQILNNSEEIDINIIYNILNNIDVDELKELKLSISPHTLLIRKFPVIPVYLRGYNIKDQQILHNDISTSLNNIVKDINKPIVDNVKIIAQIEMILTNQQKKKLPKSARIPASLKDGIQGKDGLINASIDGHRVDHSGRSVITGEPYGKLGEISVPISVAQKLSKLYIITKKDLIDENFILKLEKIKPIKLIKNETIKYRFMRNNGKIINLKQLFKRIEVNDLLEIPLDDGDIVLFNRQPTIRPESLMANRIRIISDKSLKTFKLHPSCTTAYNADFDGDEMNIHILQDIRASIECIELMSPRDMIISSQKGTPIITLVQDALIGLYRLSSQEKIDRILVFDISLVIETDLKEKINQWNVIHKDKLDIKSSYFPGMFVCSLIFSKSFSGKFIQNGILIEKIKITKKYFCSGLNCVLRHYFIEQGSDKTAKLIDDIKNISDLYLSRYGYSVGITELKNNFNIYDLDINHENVNTILGMIEIDSKRIFKNTNFYDSIESGAKGNFTNIVQMGICVGQQSIDGTNISYQMKTGRSLPYFKCYDDSIQAFGFVYSNFLNGLNKTESIFHAKAGRRGVADSVNKVAESGYIVKKLSKFLEDCVIEYDGTVRNNNSKFIHQFIFGVDGGNPQKMTYCPEKKKLSVLSLGDFEKIFKTSNLGNIIPDVISSAKIFFNKNTPIIDFWKYSQINNLVKNVDFPLRTEQFTIDFDKIQEIEKVIFCRMFQPGTSIGLISALNFGEISTQLLLKSFHHSGIKDKDITSGLKRLNKKLLCRNKLLKASDSTVIGFIQDRFYEVYKQSRNVSSNENVKRTMKFLMEYMGNIITTKLIEVRFKDVVENINFFGPDDFLRQSKSGSYEIVYKINKQKLESLEISLDFGFIEQDILTIFCNDNFEKKNQEILHKIIKPGIGSDISSYWDDYYEEVVIIFKGISLNRILALEKIDSSKTFSKDPLENSEIFGIEAGRKSLYKEIDEVLSFDGADIDMGYIDFICDVLCRNGILRSINSESLTVKEHGVMSSSMFEKTIKKFTRHSLHNIVDNTRSLESCIFLGKLGKLGTGFFDIGTKKNNKFINIGKLDYNQFKQHQNS